MKRIAHSIFLPATLVAALVLVLPAAAQAETPTGSPVITIPLGKSGKGLKAKGVKVSAFGGGVIRGDSVGLLVSDISVAGTQRMNLVLRGGVKLKAKKRTATLKGLFVQIRSNSVTITAKAGRKRITLITGKLDAPAQFDFARISASFSARKASLTAGAAKYLRKKLKHFKPRSRTLGKIAGGVFVTAPPQTGAVTPPATAYSCLPVAGPSTDPSRPSTASDLSCGYLVLNTRDSWTKYIELNTPIAPASGLPAIDGKDHVCPDSGTAGFVDAYSFSLPVQSGWWDAPSGTGYLVAAGGVHYHSDERGIDVTITNLEVNFSGGSSIVHATTTNSSDPTPKRIAFATFNAAAPMAGAAPGPGVALSRLKLTLTDEALGGLFGWMYSSGSGFGCIDTGFGF